MMQAVSNSNPGYQEGAIQRVNHRSTVTTPLRLLEVERASVVDAISPDSGAGSQYDTVFAMGTMRELCPHCNSTHLQLILRQKRVRHAHLFCDHCERCYDARYLDGAPALEMGG
ncbi:MAG TPA: hypothetical protein VIF60_24245 [Burkholderiaceae bacterium]